MPERARRRPGRILAIRQGPLRTTLDGSTTKAAEPGAVEAVDLLATLPVKGRAPKTGHERALFGPTWADVDLNGCDIRNDILRRDLTEVTYTNSVLCKVQTGMLADPYTGSSISFVRGTTTSTAVQIDHVVALNNTWQKGAQPLRRQGAALTDSKMDGEWVQVAAAV